jgi:thiol-disulfide isomerase/thioredoxin
MQRKIGIWLGVCLLVGFFLWPYQAVAQEEKPLVPDFTLMSNRGEPVSLSDYAGRVVVLNFWASWCPPCRAEMPEFQKLHEELEETGEAVLLMLNQIDGVRETVASGEKYLNDNGFTFLNLHDNGTVGGRIFGLPGIPVTVVIDPDGYMDNYIIGPASYAAVKRMIEEAK